MKWEVPHSFDLFEYQINFTSSISSVVCTTVISEEILNQTTLQYDATAPDCILNASTSYYATVQIKSLNNQFIVKGNVSSSSNFQETGIQRATF